MELLLVFGALGAFLIVRLVRGDRGTRALERLADGALADAVARRAAIVRLEGEVKAQHLLPASRVVLARLYLADDRAEAALAELDRAGDDALLSDRLIVERATARLGALVRLRRFDEAEHLLDRFPRLFLDEASAALWADARAQVRLGKGDAEGALAVLEAAEPIPGGVRHHLELTLLRVLAARGCDDDKVWNRLRAQPREVLQVLARRHSVEPAARIALRLLDGGTYR